MASAGHDIYFLRLVKDAAFGDDRPLPDRVQPVDAGFTGRPPGQGNLLTWMPAVARVLNDVQPRLVQAGPIQSCAFLTALSGFRPLISMSWGSDLLVEAEADELALWATRYTLDRSARVVTDCAEVSDRVFRYSSLRRDSIIQFPWGVDLDIFRPEGRRHPIREAWSDAFIVLSVRAWEPSYGVLTLLDGFRRARARNPRLKLVLLGDGTLGPQVRAFIAEHGLDSDIHAPGFSPYSDLPGYFRAADVYISCSKSDGSSVSLIEALATGLPAIVTDRPSNREWVTPDENGWVVPFSNVVAVSNALLNAASLAPEAHQAMRISNRRLAERRADWTFNFGKLEAVFNSFDEQRVRSSIL
ncbi:MAG TPA: glycosyltransferase [Bryobacteraceae bacterium]|nr:glycosyltransferase [Bryobacteraceae bacterium]